MIKIILDPSNIDIKKLENAFNESPPGKITIAEPVVKELKHKKGIPTVIEYQGRRYVLDHANQY